MLFDGGGTGVTTTPLRNDQKDDDTAKTIEKNTPKNAVRSITKSEIRSFTPKSEIYQKTPKTEPKHTPSITPKVDKSEKCSTLDLEQSPVRSSLVKLPEIDSHR